MFLSITEFTTLLNFELVLAYISHPIHDVMLHTTSLTIPEPMTVKSSTMASTLATSRPLLTKRPEQFFRRLDCDESTAVCKKLRDYANAAMPKVEKATFYTKT